jgi:uroporphyrinogen-III synthase
MNASARALEGLGIVITRPRPAAESVAAALRAEGAQAFVFPSLAIEDLPPSPDLEAALEALPRADLAIFVSANAVERGLERVKRRGPWPPRTRVAAVGDATAEALRNSGFDAVISPSGRNDSEALLELPPLRDVEGKRIVIFRGEGGRERLREVLESRGAKVFYAPCYRRLRPVVDAEPLLAAWSRGEIHAVGAWSAESLENFVAMIGAEGGRFLGSTALVVPHEAIAAHRDARRFGRVVVAAPERGGILQALASLRLPR